MEDTKDDSKSDFVVEIVGAEPTAEYHAKMVQEADAVAEKNPPKRRGRPPKVKKESVESDVVDDVKPKRKPKTPRAPTPPPAYDEVVMFPDFPEPPPDADPGHPIEDTSTLVGAMQLQALGQINKRLEMLTRGQALEMRAMNTLMRGQALQVSSGAISMALLSGIVFLLWLK